MRFRPAFVGILLLLIASGVVVAAGTTASSGLGANPAQAGSTPSFERADPGLVVTVQLREDGDARWHITHRFLVNGTNETRAFERFAADVRAGDRDLGASREAYERFAAAASETTERDMQIRDANWTSASVENGTGTVTYSFTWTNFGRVDGDRVFVGDAFRSADGTWFPRLYDGQRLIVRPPSALNIVGTPPDKGLNQRALVWDGYREFEPGYLSVVLERPSDTTTTPTPPGSVNTSTSGPVDPDEGLSPFLLGVGFALLLVFVGAGSYFLARWQTRQDEDEGGSPSGVTEASNGGHPPDDGAGATAESASSAGATAGEEAGAGSDAESASASTDATRSDADATASGAAAAGATGTADDDDEIDEELLSDEERVLRLLEGNGGRMKQANIVTETGWSNAKVSQLLSGMHEDEEIQKLRIGRENLIALPDENVADFGDDE